MYLHKHCDKHHIYLSWFFFLILPLIIFYSVIKLYFLLSYSIDMFNDVKLQINWIDFAIRCH